MNRYKFLAVLSLGVLCPAAALAAPLCPAAGTANAGCTTVITISAAGVLSVGAGTGGTTYDGTDDQLVGFVNNSNLTITSVSLNGGNNAIFGFDGDGVNGYLGLTDNSKDNTGYGALDSYFTNISSNQKTGTVDFITPIGPGGTTYFSLEAPFTSGSITGTVTGVTPEPSTLLLLGTGILGLAARIRSRIVPS
jgi:PEP-CTERM motif